MTLPPMQRRSGDTITIHKFYIMNELIERFGKNEVLDALWYCNVMHINITNVPLKAMLGIAGEVGGIGQLIFGRYRLIVIYDKKREGLHNLFSSDESIKDHIAHSLDRAFEAALCKHLPYIYILNIASTDNFGAFSLSKEKDLVEKQLKLYMPIIQKFMIDALTDKLGEQF